LKTILPALIAFASLALAAHAQTPPAADGGTTVTNRDELIRELLRRAALTNAPARPVRTEATPAVPTPTAPAVTTTPTVPAAPVAAPTLPVIPAAPTPAPAQTAPPAAPAAPAVPPAAPPVVPAPPALAPAAPAVPAATASATPASTAPTTKAPEPVYIGKEQIQLKALPLEEFLERFYTEAVGRTVIRPATLPKAEITLKLNNALTRSEYIQLLDSVLAMNQITMIPVGEKFVKAVPTPQALTEAAEFDKRKSSELPDSGQYITHVVQLQYVRPSEVQPIIMPFAKTPTGVVPIEASGVLVLRDFTENVKRMLEVIEKVDIAMPLDIKSEVIPIKYALASEIAGVLGSLQGSGGGVTTGTSAGGTGATRRGALGASTGAGFGGGGVGPSTVGGYSSGTLGGNTRTGTLGQTGAVGGFNTGGGTLGGAGGTFGAAGATQSAFQNRLQQIVNRAATGAGQGGFQILGEVRIITVDTANSLLVFAAAQDMAMIKKVIAQLDVVQPQVLIESIIMEVSLDEGFTLGVSAGQRPKQYNPTVQGGGIINNNGQLGVAQQFLGSVMSNGVTQFPTGNGFAWFGNITDDWVVAVNAAANDGRINVLSRPRIQTSHAVEASLFIGDTVPYITGTISDISGSRSQYQQLRVGITLNVLPLINPEGLVVMDISQSIQQLGTPTSIDGNDVPTTTERSAAAKVAVRDGEAVMLGGLISSSRSRSKSGVPFLKDIPGIGYLFRSTTDSSRRVELIVLMRPLVLPTPEAASIMAQNERETLPGIKSAIDDTTQAILDLRKQYGINTNAPALPTITPVPEN
jgi:general secretion pathway protein D